jgi:ankyrin repeat protein
MKNLIKIIVMVAFVSNSLSFIEAAQRRAGTRAAREIFSRNNTAGLGRSVTTKNFKSTTPVTCPKGSRSFFTESGSTLGGKARRFGQQAGEFTKTHKSKLLTIGTAGAAYGAGMTLSEVEKQRSKIQENLKEFYKALWSYDNSLKANQNLDILILRLEENGGINQKNEFGNTPLMMVIAEANLDSQDRKKILKALIAHGAKPDQKELASALNLSNRYQEDLFFLPFAAIIKESHLAILNILLPYYDEKILKEIIEKTTDAIKDINKEIKHLDPKVLLRSCSKSLQYWKDHKAEQTKKSSNPKELEGYQKFIDFYKTLLYDLQNNPPTEEENQQKEEQLKLRLENLRQILDIAKKALNKGKLSGTSAYKEEDWTVAR